MDETLEYWEEQQWIIWNGTLGLRDFVMIDRVEDDKSGRLAWLEEPYDMVGPFDFDELENSGCIRFAACVVMSREKWQNDRTVLMHEAMTKRRAAQQRAFEELRRANRRKQRHGSPMRQNSEREHRKLLRLPVDGELDVIQIKAAFRQLAKTAHPDAGGSHELFIRITEARDVLIELAL